MILLGEFMVLVGEFVPFAVVLETLHVLWGELHLCEFLREMLHAILVVELGLVGSRLLLFVNGIPIYGREPRMCHDFLGVRLAGAQPRHGILVQKLGANVPCFFAQKREVKLWLTVFDITEKLFLVFAVEGRFPAQHLVNDTSEGPPVCRLPMTLVQKYFRRQVLSSATNTLGIIMSPNVFF